MAYILNIHTSTETAIVNLISGEQIIDTLVNTESKKHASFLHAGIQNLLNGNGIDIRDISAIGAGIGPGSYTGIRIGLATAKGLCYALKIPLITYHALELIALTAISFVNDPESLYCPMIDARRMEVYTAMYNYAMIELALPSANILDENSFSDMLNSNKIYFSGSGSEKFKKICKSKNAFFIKEEISTKSLAQVSIKKFEKREFENITSAQPLYIKEFHTF
jgi:tRNA threonylcarbamoyladenosine biosynthesis protein TsaB